MESAPILSSRLVVTFRSGMFNTSSPEKHFISRRSYGGDLANWLIYELTQRNAAAEPLIGQKDDGWLVRFRFGGASYDFVVRYRHPDWIATLERRRGLIALLFRRPPKNVEFDAVALMHSALSSSDLISNIEWHYDDDLDAAHA